MRTFQLSDGAAIPALGLGTYRSKKNEVAKAVDVAIRAGYRHLDLALIYANQHEVGSVLKEVIPSVVRREELFITSKLWNSNHLKVEQDIDQTLRELGTPYLDLYLMHWPVAFKSIKAFEVDTSASVAETWLAMKRMKDLGKVKNIGVSNFTARRIEELIAATGVKPAVNQVELHPLLRQDDLLVYAKAQGIHITAYFPIGGAPSKKHKSLLQYPEVEAIAAKYPGATTAQVLLAWGLSRGYSVIPKSVTPDRIKSNLKELALSKQDIDLLTALGEGKQQRLLLPARDFKWDINLFDTPEETYCTHQPRIGGPKSRM